MLQVTRDATTQAEDKSPTVIIRLHTSGNNKPACTYYRGALSTPDRLENRRSKNVQCSQILADLATTVAQKKQVDGPRIPKRLVRNTPLVQVTRPSCFSF